MQPILFFQHFFSLVSWIRISRYTLNADPDPLQWHESCETCIIRRRPLSGRTLSFWVRQELPPSATLGSCLLKRYSNQFNILPSSFLRLGSKLLQWKVRYGSYSLECLHVRDLKKQLILLVVIQLYERAWLVAGGQQYHHAGGHQRHLLLSPSSGLQGFLFSFVLFNVWRGGGLVPHFPLRYGMVSEQIWIKKSLYFI